MLDLFCPHWVFDDYTAVTPEFLQTLGVRLLLTDLDYTLAPKRQKEADDAVKAWIDALHAAGIELVILSNNRNPLRVRRFCAPLGVSFVGHAQKPARRGYRRAMERFGASPQETAMLGDKLLTDTLGARRSGLTMLMVEPKGGPVGLWNHVLHALQEPFKAGAAHDERAKRA